MAPLLPWGTGSTLAMNMRTILSPSVAVFESCGHGGCMSTLDRLGVGTSARVADVTGEDPVAIRLLEMGLTPGVAVRVVGHAPFGDPVELELRSYRLSIRRAEAARVTVH